MDSQKKSLIGVLALSLVLNAAFAAWTTELIKKAKAGRGELTIYEAGCGCIDAQNWNCECRRKETTTP